MARQIKRHQRVEPSFEGKAYSANTNLRSKKRPTAVSSSKNKPTSSRRKPKNRTKGTGFLRKSMYWTFVLAIWGGIGLSLVVGYYAIKLPQSSSWAIPDRPPNAKIVSVNGELIANRGITGGQDMRLDEMSPYIPMAVIAVEDRRFKSHFGIDPLGLARAMVTNVLSGRLVQGGSTLTQQLAKNLFLEPERNLERKVQEAILALWLEREFSKDEILELYLNRVYFGSGATGVAAASRRYFGKSARDVNLAEAAMLAGLLKAPSKLSPANNPELAEERAQVVLGAMRQADFITDREAETALTMQANRAKRYWSGSENYVADMVMKQLPALIGELRSDIVIDTSIDLDLQKAGGKLVAEAIGDLGKKLNVSQGAMVALDGTGAVRALVGGVEYADSQFNRAVDAKRQPGSAFKPIVYLAALETGLDPGTIRLDKPVRFGKWSPENYNRKYLGPVTLEEALSKSINTVAAQLAVEVGPTNVTRTAKRLGIQSPLLGNASIALGTSEVSLLELTSAYAPFANGGYLTTPYLIRRITTEAGEVLYSRIENSALKVVGSREISMMNQMLQRTITDGTGKTANLKDWQVAGKTGTSQNSRDAWFIGYTANLITGFWYGNDDGTPTNKVTGGSIPARSFASFMTLAHKGVPVADLPGAYISTTVFAAPSPLPKGEIHSGSNASVQETDILSADQPWASAPWVEGQRRPLSTITGAIPKPPVGMQTQTQRNKPKNIIELLLGR